MSNEHRLTAGQCTKANTEKRNNGDDRFIGLLRSKPSTNQLEVNGQFLNDALGTPIYILYIMVA